MIVLKWILNNLSTIFFSKILLTSEQTKLFFSTNLKKIKHKITDNHKHSYDYDVHHGIMGKSSHTYFLLHTICTLISNVFYTIHCSWSPSKT